MSEEERRLASADREMLESARTGEGLVEITSPETFKELQQAAAAAADHFREVVADLLTDDRAAFVRRLRVDDHYSWRAVAEACYLEWDGDWFPPSNQIMGMTLCEQAAERFDEHYMKEPWN